MDFPPVPYKSKILAQFLSFLFSSTLSSALSSFISGTLIVTGCSGLLVTHISPRKIPTLQHELRYDPMELRAFEPEPFLTRTQCAEVLCGFGDDVVVQVEFDSASVCWTKAH